MEKVSGFLLVDKPSGWTSHDVVAKVRGIVGTRRVGHGGTLDPLATGLLVLGLGSATKELERFVEGEKTYFATMRLGATSSTDDAEGKITPAEDPQPPSRGDIDKVLRYFHGLQLQLPPEHAALKTGGKRYYHLARKGLYVPRREREVMFHEVKLERYKWPEVDFRAVVGRGTYIRSMARDAGDRLGVGAYLTALRRESVGEYSVSRAAQIKDLEKDWQPWLIPLTEAVA